MLSLVALGAAAVVRYDGHQVFRVVPQTHEQLSMLAHLNPTPDFWREPSFMGRPVDIRVAPADKAAMLSVFQSANLSASVYIQDVETHFQQSHGVGTAADWDDAYHNLADINKWMQDLVSANPKIASLFDIGQTYENRTVYGIKITSTVSANKPQIYYDGGIHAREWISPAVVQYVIGQLIKGYGTDAEITRLVDTVEWYLVPVFNADGYEFSWKNDRNWRKNRQPNDGSRCIGTDPCRNADAGFGGPGSDSNPCGETYRGVAAFSAPIVKAASVFLASLPRLKGYINFHSYAELWLTPYGYTATKPRDYDTQMAFGKAATAAIKAVHGISYPYGPAYTTIYPASGIISDWAYDKLKVVLSQAVELRGTSFAPPPTEIRPNGEEILAAVKVHAKSVLAL